MKKAGTFGMTPLIPKVPAFSSLMHFSALNHQYLKWMAPFNDYQ
ncbi:hypothetical protein Nizo3894_1897 [Lactiplantibacillus plantarum]|nr:hypothetical protein LBP_cg0071 [Lactiplantibacillus plantarum subsp. plantarum P-8]AOG32638.1 hypothetical protein AWV72_01862 [Lactiplantibacillus plantarum]KPN86516.1 hypothetical protein Nizo2877_0374 [Lactiplantibacillus plantarum]KZU50813.1 hypothetical protein Nizo2801_2576 [Lactiplantibacillus plantarum]KZU86944.1 hypothetical protein Nizo3894_1897 [Lactiplantibacillus plantarum]